MTLTTEQQKRLAQVTVLRAGAGKTLDTACVMQAVDWVDRNEDHLTDAPPCASTVLRHFAIRLNDARWPTDQDRTAALRPAIEYLIGTATADIELEQRRRYRLVDFAIREAAPYWFDYAYEKTKKPLYKEHAEKMRAVKPITSAATMEEARVVARAAAYAAYAAAAAAAADARLTILQRAAEVLIEAAQIR